MTYRYSATLRFHQDAFVKHGKQAEPVPALLRVAPFVSGFCQFVLREGVLTTENSLSDVRLDGHSYQEIVISYPNVKFANDTGQALAPCAISTGQPILFG